jgi:hypothetical protein
MILRAKGTYSGFDWAFSTTIFNVDINVSGVDDLVSQTSNLCPDHDLQELVLLCHGVDGKIYLGNDILGLPYAPGADPYYRLAPLWPLFVSSSIGLPRLIFEVCETGKNPAVLLEIANTIGHAVYGCTGDVRPNCGLTEYGTWYGDTLVAYPGAPTTANLGYGQRVPPTPTILA